VVNELEAPGIQFIEAGRRRFPGLQLPEFFAVVIYLEVTFLRFDERLFQRFVRTRQRQRPGLETVIFIQAGDDRFVVSNVCRDFSGHVCFSYSSSSRNFARTEKSSSVVVSPTVALPEARSRSRRRMILPLRVFGRASVKRISSGFAKLPIALATCILRSSLR